MTTFHCRICGSADHEVILDYGRVALADAFLSDASEAATEPKEQLTLVFCRACAHVQIKEIIDRELLFRNYVWETGIGGSAREYCREFVGNVLDRDPEAKSVLEIASNDGTMLRAFMDRGLRVLGVDPARNIVAKALERGIPSIAEFFDEATAKKCLAEHGTFDLVVGRNVLAHAAELHSLVEGIRTVLSPKGTAVIEVPHLLTLYQQLQYDQVFHEHIGFHSLDSIRVLFAKHGMKLVDVSEAWVHGGSIRAFLKHEASPEQPSAALGAMLAREREGRILDAAGWSDFAGRVAEQRRLLRALLEDLRRAGKRVAGYGASGKGQSMIQFCGLDASLVSFIADRSTMKVGKLTPGSHIPIVTVEHLREQRPDVVVVFAWNLANEIVAQERALKERGTRFIHPIPVPHEL